MKCLSFFFKVLTLHLIKKNFYFTQNKIYIYFAKKKKKITCKEISQSVHSNTLGSYEHGRRLKTALLGSSLNGKLLESIISSWAPFLIPIYQMKIKPYYTIYQ